MRYKKSNLKSKTSALADARNDVIRVREGLKKRFLKLGGRNFGAYQSKEIDRFLNAAFEAVKFEYFGDFAPSDEQIPVCALAIGSYAFGEVNFNSKVDFAVIYKDLAGYDAEDFSRALVAFVRNMGIDASPHIYEVSRLFDTAADDNELKTLFGRIRFVCASKKLYKEAKAEIERAKENGKEAFFAYHLGLLAPYDDAPFLSQRPNLKVGYGGFYDFKRVVWLLNALDGKSPREHALAWLSEKRLGELNLSADFISSLRSALGLSGGEDVLEASFLPAATRLMQTKEKKSLEPEILMLSKTLSSMQKIALYSRYLARCEFREYFRSNLSFLERRYARKGVFYVIEGSVRTPLHAKLARLGSVSNLISNLNALPDVPLKIAVETIVFMQGFELDKSDIDAAMAEFKKLFWRFHSFAPLKALAQSELLFEFVRPLAHAKRLAQTYAQYSVDEYGLECVREVENISDKFVRGLWDGLCDEGRAALKLALLMHRAAIDSGAMGANVYRSYAAKLGLSKKITELGVSLVKNQNLLADALGGEGSQDGLNLVSHVGSPQALKALCVFTYAAQAARGDGYGASGAELKELLEEALRELKTSGEKLLDEAARRAKKEDLVRKQKDFVSLASELQNKILGIKSNLIFVKYPAAQIVQIATWAEQTPNIAVECENEGNSNLSSNLNCDTENLVRASRTVTRNAGCGAQSPARKDELCSSTKSNFTTRIIAKRGWNVNMVLAKLAHLDLAYMEIFELFENKIFVLLKFEKSASEAEMKNMQGQIVAALCDKTRPKAGKCDISADEIACEFDYSPNYAKITINARDSRGLMANLLAAFGEVGITVANARIQTVKNRTRDLFLVEREADLELKFEKLKEILIKG